MLHPSFLLIYPVHRRADPGGAYRAAELIEADIRLDGVTKASAYDSKKLVEICAICAQKGTIDIFLTRSSRRSRSVRGRGLRSSSDAAPALAEE